jgi:hypothetical protein
MLRPSHACVKAIPRENPGATTADRFYPHPIRRFTLAAQVRDEEV